MTVAVDATLRVVPTFDIAGLSKAQNVYHLLHQTATAQSETLVIAACLELIEDLMDEFVALISDEVSLEDITVYELVAGAWEPIGSIQSTWEGASAADRTPAGVALMVRLFKERTGFVDRKYIAGFTEGSVSGDVWNASILTAAAAYVVTMYSPFTATNNVVLRPVHFNRTDQTTKVYNGGAGDPTVSYQRRRKPGVGLT